MAKNTDVLSDNRMTCQSFRIKNTNLANGIKFEKQN